MKQFATGFSMVAALLLGLTSLSAQNLIWSENFANGIPAGWNNADASGNNVLWTYCPDADLGNNDPGCAPIFTGQVAFASETEANGFVVLDSDEGGELPSNHVCELTTTAIDLSGVTQAFVTFNTHIGVFSVDASTGALLRVSTNGNDWTEFTIFPGLTTAERWSDNPAIPIVNITPVAAGQSTVYLQFQWTGNYEYMWEIDDIIIFDGSPAPANDLVLGDFFYPASSFATPASQIATDTFGFYGYVSNNGSATQNNVTLKAIVRVDGGAVLFQDSITIASLDPGVQDSLLILPNQFAPELPEGDYRVEYEVYSDATDATPNNNRNGSPFVVTDLLFSKENGPEQGFRPGAGGDYTVANLYTMSTLNLEQFMATSCSFTFAVNPNTIPVTDVAAGINLLRVNDDIAADWSNFDDADLFSPSLTGVGFASYEGNPSMTNYQIQTVDLYDISTGEIGVPLDPGARYFIAVSYEGANNVVFHAYNDNVATFFVNSVIYTTQWFLGGYQGDRDNAVVRLGLSLVTSTDEKPLAENSMRVYPNPVVNNTLGLELNFETPTDATITIADMSGRVVAVRDRVGVTKENVSFNLPQLASGSYIARIATKEGTLTKKFVVQQ